MVTSIAPDDANSTSTTVRPKWSHLVNESYQDVVSYVPPEKSPEGEAMFLKFQTHSGEVLRLRFPGDIARHLGTQLLLLSGTSVDR